ncbi:uncharacterized protein FOMMEDRAFT_162262 [Fomitiporia mediterranea MF3/22]|uniref:uncharacterized protein n=1 Tax=Fomitiporia mediterranea (strain MF3/22) TaxID=694068 RepID=UPI00044099EC|nr:uncharacterized protein FOMMEDRAFT_162262 [Fomitiporia mediterranea MF3/22]EJC97918.1 hypothetical protein FOMMEDRAFT_162262 [Fomitiporia mediterranea MF3/22]
MPYLEPTHEEDDKRLIDFGMTWRPGATNRCKDDSGSAGYSEKQTKRQKRILLAPEQRLEQNARRDWK